MPLITIDDSADDRIADYRAVSNPELAVRRGLFVAEGRLVVRRLLTASRFEARSVLVTQPALAALADATARHPDLPVFVVPQAVMNLITGFNIHRGCLALGERPAALRWQDVIKSPPPQNSNPALPIPDPRPPALIVVLEGVANADNIGGVFRTAAAFGANAVLLDAGSTDPLYRKAIRTSMGASLQVPFARAEPWPEALLALRNEGFAVIAMTPAASSSVSEAVRAVSGRPVAFVLGHEGAGLTVPALDACELRARIPIAPEVDSLNVVTAAAVAFYELRRL